MLIKTILFIIGFYILIRGSKSLIKGASSVARMFKMPGWVIGLVIVGIGTSIPEFSINIASVWSNSSIGLGTIVGSNTFNTLFILGIVTLISPINFKRQWIKEELLINIGVILLVIFLAFFPILGNPTYNGITFEEGLILISLFIFWLFRTLFSDRGRVGEEEDGYAVLGLGSSFALIIFGIIGVFIGGHWVVSGAEYYASLFGITDTLIGLTLIGIGTSISELSVSITAALEGKKDMAAGNIIGSNIFDFLGIFGITSLLAPIPFGYEILPDIAMTVFATLLLFISMFVGRKYSLSRLQGLLFIFIYILYFAFIAFRF